ncbi:FAD-binding oxidoreductase [Legionella cardiaca]|uniref:FAD-binding oxidoreductase n=1 Tax=Legionella cardiaca TaxID=1071983 RepID=A0ABY8ATF8_9GAMM|nr:FAD-binding oxidoreductase [Legionella cardiaca]WED43954.1 FAD-binding oxidoreductase [Legionella cardiaca]
MQQMHWNMSQIKQCEKETGEAMLSDEHTLTLYSRDFGKITQTSPAAACLPSSSEKLQLLLNYAYQHHLPLTIRGNGLSQCGQSLPVEGGMAVHLEKLNQIGSLEEASIWVDANTSWSALIKTSLQCSQIPYVIPYNCNLSVGGVLSAGGVGASSFKYGNVISHVKALEVITADGSRQMVEAKTDLFRACLSGQGRVAIIAKACLNLRPCLKNVRTFFLVYLDKEQWLNDIQTLKDKADYLESFCSPSIQGAKITSGKRLPFAQWLFALHVAKEYDNTPPQLGDLSQQLQPWKILHTQDEEIDSYLHRHDSRFEGMKLMGQWDLLHPWYECFIPGHLLMNLESILEQLPLYYATVLQIVPIARQPQVGFFMLPDSEQVFAVMILTPGVNEKLLPGCLHTIEMLDSLFLTQGGKRYLSGYLGQNLPQNYWQNHFGSSYEDWLNLKKKYDPRSIFRSQLFTS